MPNILCPDNFAGCDCVDSNPLANLSAEAPDLPVFLSTAFFSVIPPLGASFGQLQCMAFCESATSQEAADLCAELAAFECVGSGIAFAGGGPTNQPVPPPQNPLGRLAVPLFTNSPQSATVNCPDGLPFTFTVPGGIFGGFSQLEADLQAETYALQQAQLHVLCLGPIQGFACANAPYSAAITATGNFLAVLPQADIWEISGNLPPGLSIPEFIFTTGAVTGGVIHIVGTPTTIGTYTFTITITDPSGDFISKDYTITVQGIMNANALPDAIVGQPYSQDLIAVGFVNPVFSVDPADLPDGLTMNSAGQITGTPTTQEDSFFTVSVTEAGTSTTCDADCEIAVDSGVCMFAGSSVTAIVPGPNTLVQSPSFSVYAANADLIIGGTSCFDFVLDEAFLDIIAPSNQSIAQVEMNTPDKSQPQDAVYYPPNGLVYISATIDEVIIFNPMSRSIVSVIHDPNTQNLETSMAVDTFHQRIYICQQSSLKYLDVNTNALVVIDTSADTEGGMDYAINSDLICANLNSGLINLYSGVSLATVGFLPAPSAASVAYSPIDDCLYVNSGFFGTGTVIYKMSATINQTVGANFVVPAVNANVSVTFSSTAGMIAGKNIVIGGKNYTLVSISSLTVAVVKNLNDTPGNTVTNGTSAVTTGAVQIASLLEGAAYLQYSAMHKAVMHIVSGTNTTVGFIDPVTHTLGPLANYTNQQLGDATRRVGTAANCDIYFPGSGSGLNPPIAYFVKK